RNINEWKQEEETVYTRQNDGSSTPYVVKTLQPLIEGVVVVAQGGDRPEVRRNITEAIVALFDIEPHKIKVVKMKSE
ncbi:MAG: stage III sporulation protein AG, partial [Kineothrix sp.]|nr:stage III sporulation protein AG [Kineothrix sp.]